MCWVREKHKKVLGFFHISTHELIKCAPAIGLRACLQREWVTLANGLKLAVVFKLRPFTSSQFFLDRRAKRSRHANDHARDWRTRRVKKEEMCNCWGNPLSRLILQGYPRLPPCKQGLRPCPHEPGQLCSTSFQCLWENPVLYFCFPFFSCNAERNYEIYFQ